MTPEQIILKAKEIRREIIKMLAGAGSGHAAGSLDMADIFAALYFGGILKYRPDQSWWEERDRLILSSGHIVPVWYATLSEAGFFPKAQLETLRCLDSSLQGHPHARSLPGIENTAGSLGQGISLAAGVSLALKMKYQQTKIPRLPRVVCITGDGELQEGQCWEAFMFASKAKLDNLTYVIDRNHIQIDGFTEEVMPLEPLREKLEAFGLYVLEIDGHNIAGILDAFAFDLSLHSKPLALIAHTTAGKGVEFMENLPQWHGIVPLLPGEAQEALEEIGKN